MVMRGMQLCRCPPCLPCVKAPLAERYKEHLDSRCNSMPWFLRCHGRLAIAMSNSHRQGTLLATLHLLQRGSFPSPSSIELQQALSTITTPTLHTSNQPHCTDEGPHLCRLEWRGWGRGGCGLCLLLLCLWRRRGEWGQGSRGGLATAGTATAAAAAVFTATGAGCLASGSQDDGVGAGLEVEGPIHLASLSYVIDEALHKENTQAGGHAAAAQRPFEGAPEPGGQVGVAGLVSTLMQQAPSCHTVSLGPRVRTTSLMLTSTSRKQ
eukprot:1140194-Pelagomonas_calceolata.AAC.2